jgi:hypothetical protein
MMQSVQHGVVAHSMTLRKSMLRLGRRRVRGRRDTRTQAHVNQAVIVVAYLAMENVNTADNDRQ